MQILHKTIFVSDLACNQPEPTSFRLGEIKIYWNIFGHNFATGVQIFPAPEVLGCCASGQLYATLASSATSNRVLAIMGHCRSFWATLGQFKPLGFDVSLVHGCPKRPKIPREAKKNKTAPFLKRTDKQLDKWTKEQAKEEQGVSSSRTIIIIFFVLQIKKQMAVSCSGRSLARGGSTRQFPPPYPPTTTQPFSRFIYRIFVWGMCFTYVLIFHKFSNSFPFWPPQPTTSRSAAWGKSRNLSMPRHLLLTLKDSKTWLCLELLW